ncbi:hypothetical protein LguiA_013581 [Lonicera macranthoides]
MEGGADELDSDRDEEVEGGEEGGRGGGGGGGEKEKEKERKIKPKRCGVQDLTKAIAESESIIDYHEKNESSTRDNKGVHEKSNHEDSGGDKPQQGSNEEGHKPSKIVDLCMCPYLAPSIYCVHTKDNLLP